MTSLIGKYYFLMKKCGSILHDFQNCTLHVQSCHAYLILGDLSKKLFLFKMLLDVMLQIC